MSIVKCKGKNGRVYAYLSTSHYDPEKKSSRPTRKYLGRVDPETGEIIPTRGKRSSAEAEEAKKDAEAAAKKELEGLRAQLLEERLRNEELEVKIRSQQKETVQLQSEVRSLKGKLSLLQQEVNKVCGTV